VIVVPSRRHPTVRAAARRRAGPVGRVARLALATGLTVAVAVLAAGCVGREDRNDDHVGPYSFRPDSREHTLRAPDRPPGGSVG
jgi:hypothetical protein